MNNIKKVSFILAGLIYSLGSVYAAKEEVYVDRIFVSDYSLDDIANEHIPNNTSPTFLNEDKTISYYAKIGIINPKKNQYEFELYCKDKKGGLVIKKIWKKDISEFKSYRVGNDLIREQMVTLTLDPRQDKLVAGQLMPLKDRHKYVVNLFVDKKLIGSTEFDYLIDK